METYLDITKGLHTDFEPINQPAGTYSYLLNGIRQLSGAIENEKGTALIPSIAFYVNDGKVIGSYVLDNDIILFIYNTINYTSTSEIGILTQDDVYTTITTDSSLGFTASNIVRAEGKKNFKGDRIIYFTGKGLPMRVLNIDSVPTVNFNNVTKAVLTATMPQINITGVVEGGSLPSGIYQFGTRLLTKSTNSTGVSLLTNYVPIVNETTTNRDEYDGAPPQTDTNKAIELNITNVDISYEFIEIIAITAVGTGNVTKVDVIARLPIQGRATIPFTYTSTTSQFRESLDINALVIDQTNYDSAEFVIQKDGVLMFAGLTTATDSYNFQVAANGITIKYVIKEEIWNESINISNGVDIGNVYSVGNDYKNPSQVLEFKSYQRDEVYSFAVVPIFKNWNMGNAYHIPGKVNLNAAGNKAPADTTSNDLGTYYSSEIYPTGKGYPLPVPGYNDARVRHHLMPSLIQEPHVQVRNGTTYIRMLGIRVDLTSFIAAIPQAIKNNIIGYVIVKQKRDDANKSILAQGIATGHNAAFGSSYTSMPFAQFPYLGGGGPAAIATDYTLVAFYSPESTITQNSLKAATQIKPVIELTGITYKVSSELGGNIKHANVLLNYNATTTNTTLLNSSRNLNSNATQYIPAGQEVTADDIFLNSVPPPSVYIAGTSKSVLTWRNPGYLFLQISNGTLPVINTLYGDGKGEIFYKFENTSNDGFYLNNSNTNSTGTSARHLYNLTRELSSQYGAVFNAKYHYVKHVMTDSVFNPIIDCFNGDTFITKYSVLNSTGVGFLRTPLESFDVTLKGLSYIWVESSINCGYRHYNLAVGKEGDANYKVGTLPYYPKVKQLYSSNPVSPGIFNYSTSLGHPTGYNKQYSFENTIRPYFPTPLELEIITDFPNKIIYSEQSVEGEQLDAFRIFLPNNYHDIPRSKGKITNLFILANTLYTHTERSLWKNYFNEQVSQASSAGEVYLGNGGIFNRPSTEVITVAGGYAGTNSALSSCTTPFGHFFMDGSQKKVFMFSDTLDEISDKGMFKYFNDNLSVIDDKPALGTGYTSIYDYFNKRWLLTKIGQWTISYSTQLKSWSSFHSYTPYQYFNVGSRVYSCNEFGVYVNNIGIHGAYYGNIPSPLQLDLNINDAPQETKTLDNLVFYTTAQSAIKREQHYDTFNTLQVYNTTKNTGKCRLIVPRTFEDEFVNLGVFEVLAKLKSNEFRVAIPSDMVLNVNNDIFAGSNLDSTRAYRPRVSGKYFTVSLSYNNLRDNKFILHNIGRIFRQRIR